MKKSIYFFLSLVVLFSACKDKEDPAPATTNNPGSGGGTVITSSLYFQATIDGQEVIFQNGINGYASAAGSSGESVTSGYGEGQSMSLLKPFATKNIAGVVIIKKFTDMPSLCSEIEGMFSIGAYPYGKHSGDVNDAVEGAVVYYIDGSGKAWSSDNGAGTQTGSTFQITEHVSNSDGFSQRITKATFSCKLYDEEGNVKTLTNGSIRSRSVQCGGL